MSRSQDPQDEGEEYLPWPLTQAEQRNPLFPCGLDEDAYMTMLLSHDSTAGYDADDDEIKPESEQGGHDQYGTWSSSDLPWTTDQLANTAQELALSESGTNLGGDQAPRTDHDNDNDNDNVNINVNFVDLAVIDPTLSSWSNHATTGGSGRSSYTSHDSDGQEGRHERWSCECESSLCFEETWSSVCLRNTRQFAVATCQRAALNRQADLPWE